MTYNQLIQFNLQTSKNSIQNALAELAKVSPLRIIDIHVSVLKEGAFSKRREDTFC